MAGIRDAGLNHSYLVVCPHGEDCDFGCRPHGDKHVIDMLTWERIKTDDEQRIQFKDASALAFGEIKTIPQ